MATKKNFLGLVDAGRQIRRAPLVGMQFLHESPVRPPDGGGIGARLQAKDLIGFLFGHFAAVRRSSLPRVRTTLIVRTPSGLPAVKISHQ